MKESEITKEEFIRISNESKTRIEAYRTLGMHRNTYNKYCLEFNYDFDNCHGGKKYRVNHKYDLKDIFDGKYPHYNTSHLNNRLIKEGYKERKCECCGNSEWLNRPIVLELHHIDGNHSNNALENLQLLCPNCHAITDNFKSKNIKHYKKLKN